MAMKALIHTSTPGRRFGFVLFTVVVVVLLVKLGMWQLSRAEQKNQLESDFKQRQQVEFLGLNALPEDADYYRLTLAGQWLSDRPILLDNQIYKGRVGYQLHYALQTNDGVALVNLGWLPAPNHREQLPDLSSILPSPTGKVSGLLTAPSLNLVLGEGDMLGEVVKTPNDTLNTNLEIRRVQRLDINALSTQLNMPLIPYVLQLDENHPLALVSIWTPTVISPQKHVGYAVQWFAMAFAVSIAALFWLRRTR